MTWTATLHMIDDCGARDILSPYWYVNYTTPRSELAKQIHAVRPDALPSTIRQVLEAEWEFDTEQAIRQLGGTPRGWCGNFIAHLPDAMLLLQIPSNNLTDLHVGNVADLVISISAADLKHHCFEVLRVDVSD